MSNLISSGCKLPQAATWSETISIYWTNASKCALICSSFRTCWSINTWNAQFHLSQGALRALILASNVVSAMFSLFQLVLKLQPLALPHICPSLIGSNIFIASSESTKIKWANKYHTYNLLTEFSLLHQGPETVHTSLSSLCQPSNSQLKPSFHSVVVRSA